MCETQRGQASAREGLWLCKKPRYLLDRRVIRVILQHIQHTCGIAAYHTACIYWAWRERVSSRLYP
jgi:hypothetical protein